MYYTQHCCPTLERRVPEIIPIHGYLYMYHCLWTFQLHFDELFEAIRNPERLHAYIQFISNFFHSYISVLPIPLRCEHHIQNCRRFNFGVTELYLGVK